MSSSDVPSFDISTPAPPPVRVPANGHANGKPNDIQIHQQPPQTAEPPFDLASYIYNAGFIHAAWADTFLNINPHPPLRLHALLASRSPLLYRFLTNYVNQGPPYTINISCNDSNITTAALSMALATLYGHQLDLTNCNLVTAKGLLASGSLLGLESVAVAGYQVIVNSVSKDTLGELIAFALSNVKRPQSGLSSSGGAAASGTSSTSSTSSSPAPDHGANSNNAAFDDVQIAYQGPYPPFTNQLLSILINFLLSDMNGSERPLDPAYKSILVGLPFYVYKEICESDKLKVKSHMERHSFAREITGLREQARRCQLQANPGLVTYEENVVLAFGGGKGGVEVIRKLAGKKKTLWKAGQ